MSVFFNILWYSHMITKFKFRIFIVIFNIKINIFTLFNIGGIHFYCSRIRVIIFIHYIIQLININIFWYCFHMLINSILYDSNKPFNNNWFSFIVGWIHFYIVVFQPWFHWFVLKTKKKLPLSTHISFGLRPDSFKIAWTVLVIVIPFLPFKWKHI